jgi:hypothetical protein
MFFVIEYGENIGTLKNIFCTMSQAQRFVRGIIDVSVESYECIGPDRWFCREKDEYLMIEAR